MPCQLWHFWRKLAHIKKNGNTKRNINEDQKICDEFLSQHFECDKKVNENQDSAFFKIEFSKNHSVQVPKTGVGGGENIIENNNNTTIEHKNINNTNVVKDNTICPFESDATSTYYFSTRFHSNASNSNFR